MFRKIVKLLALFALVVVFVPVVAKNADAASSDAVPMIYCTAKARASSVGRLVGDTTYFQIRSFSDENGAISVVWDEKTATATVICSGLTLEATLGEEYIIANGRVLYTGRENFVDNGRMYVPARSICKAFGFDIYWDDETRTVFVDNTGVPIESADSYYDKNDLYWLSRIISCEAGGTEPLLGQIAVGNVVLNRVNDESSPDTVYDVIFDRRFGIQFTPAYTPKIYEEPLENAVIAAKICLEGFSVSDEALFFYAPKYVYAAWIEESREYLFTIGGHKFFA